MIKSIFSLVVLLCAAFTEHAAASGSFARSATNQLIVQLSDSQSGIVRQMRLADTIPGVNLPNGRALRFVRHFNRDRVIVRLPEDVSLDEAYQIAAQLADNPAVVSAIPNKRVYPALVPNDRQYPLQWHLFESTAGIRMSEAWDLQTGSSAVVVALLDTGIVPHLDLAPARVLNGYDFIADINTANDGDGRDADASDPGDASGLNECGPGIPAADSSWHGLAVAGVIAAQSDNLFDIAGIDFAARLLPVRVLGKCGGLVSDIIDAMRWAAGLPVDGVPNNPEPAHIINLSLSGAGACSTEEQRAIDDVIAAGALVVVAAGNDNADTATQSPANCLNVLVVGAVARDGKLASYVNTGKAVDLAAPGGDGEDGILTLFNRGLTSPGVDTLAIIQGTSFAAAQVSAVASLMLATDSSLTPATVEELLRRSAREFPDSSCTPCTCGQGILDAQAALAAAADPVAALAAEFNPPSCGGSSGSGGGGGCVLRSTRRIDPLLWILILVSAIRVGARR